MYLKITKQILCNIFRIFKTLLKQNPISISHSKRTDGRGLRPYLFEEKF